MPKEQVRGKEESLRLAQEAETGARTIFGWGGKFIGWFAIFWSLFQLYTGYFGELPGSNQLSIHLTFALVLCYLCFPRSQKSPRDRMTVPDIILAVCGGATAFYLFANYKHVVNSQGAPELYDLIIGGILIILILEATRRSVSPMLPLITSVFLVYAYIGPYIPGELAHRGFNVGRIIDHVFMSGEGLWGIPLRVSATFVFLFVLFGAFLEKIGAGQYLIDLSFATMGRYRGGPAKAAVVASAAMGSISGSSIANTVTTGAMTIPLMKKVGFKPHVAGAVEVAASTNGQLMPPIMGAAAFIMAEIIGVSYFEIVKAAFIPAILSYAAIFSIVHLEAVKENIRGLTKEETPPLVKTVVAGIHYLIPLLVLCYLLLVEMYTPTTSAAWSILVTCLVCLGNNYYRTMYLYPRRQLNGVEVGGAAYAQYLAQPQGFAPRRTAEELLGALEAGARNMAGIAAACACCGIIIGVVTLTGLGLKMATLITAAAGGSLLLTLIFSVFRLHNPGHGPAHHGHLYNHGGHDRPGHTNHKRRPEPGFAHRGRAFVRLLLRHRSGRHAAGGALRLCRRGHSQFRPHKNRLEKLPPGFGRLYPALYVHLQHPATHVQHHLAEALVYSPHVLDRHDLLVRLHPGPLGGQNLHLGAPLISGARLPFGQSQPSER